MLKCDNFCGWQMNPEMSTTTWTEAVREDYTSFKGLVGIVSQHFCIFRTLNRKRSNCEGYRYKRPVPITCIHLAVLQENQVHWLLKGPKWYFLVALKPSSDYRRIQYLGAFKGLRITRKVLWNNFQEPDFKNAESLSSYHFYSCDQLRFLTGPE